MKRWQLAWIAVVVVGLFINLGGYGLIEPDEGRNAEVAREMAATNDYVLPHLNGLPYLDKPIVFFAAAAASIEVFGANEWAVRLVPFFFALATAFLVGFFALRVFGPDEAFVAFVATATAPLALALSRIVIMDSTLSFFVVLSLVSFYPAIEGRRRALRERLPARTWIGWTLLAWAAMAVGVLTKGPVALAVPLLAAAPYAVWRRASLAVWQPLGAVLLALIVAPWVWAVSLEIPNFLEYVVLTETVARMTTDELRRSNPFWYFVPVLLAGTFPWSLLAISSLRRKSESRKSDADHRRVYLWLWLLVPFVLFSISSGKQAQYVLPLVPAVALLAATGNLPRTMGARTAAVGWGALGLVFVIAAGLGLPGVDAGPGEMAVASRTALAIGFIAILAGAFAWFFSPRRAAAVAALSVPLVLFPLVTAPAMDLVAGQRSVEALADSIAGSSSRAPRSLRLRPLPEGSPSTSNGRFRF